ncbi:MAG: hypothetical protein JWO95_1456 [Verrucomicrobiales bacterium]|nr:hypothetical protein [Verrucomicrobiales bacterium]
MFLVYLTDIPGLVLLKHHPDWPMLVRVTIVLLPFICGYLYVRGVVRWIEGMDELHQRITLQSFNFALVVYLFLSAGWFMLARAGVWDALAQSTKVHFEYVPWNNCTFIICMTYILFGAGYSTLKRRYQ